MLIDCISDLHGHYPKLEGGDLLIIAGDLTAHDTDYDWCAFETWLTRQEYKEKIIIAGNHDNFLQSMDKHCMWRYWNKISNVTYLCDNGIRIRYEEELKDAVTINGEYGTHKVKSKLKIWGTPWTRTFEGMNPQCKAFTCDTEDELMDKFQLIPHDTDILITHSPPFTILDRTTSGLQVGSCSLMAQHISHLRPKLWVFGHIHEAYGQSGPYQWNGARYVNASHVNERYEPINKPIRIEL